MDLIKYDMTDIWAVAGDVVAPEGAKIRAGWGVEVVPRQWWNWFENRQDNNIAYMLQKGFPEWDAATEYINNKSYVQRNGVVYKATATSTNSDPVALTSWVRAFTDSTPYLEKLKGLAVVANTIPAMDGSGNATSVPYAVTGLLSLNAATPADGRTAIGAQQSNSNLSALSSVTAGANNLPYFTGTTTMGIATLTSFGRSLIDDADAVAARLTLGLGTASLSDVTTSSIDTTAGRLLKVGDFGLGGATILVSDANTISASGLYLCNSTTANTALVGNGTLVHLQMSGNNASQIYINHPSGRQYNRTCSNGTWGSWVESWTTSNLVKTTSKTDTTVGRMLQVGDFGIGAQGVDITDANALANSGTGFYKLRPPFTGSPLAGGFATIIHTAYDNERTQIAITEGDTTGRMFFRKYTAGAWQPWVENYNTGNTAQIVADVTTGIQPQLDAKVSKSGDTMTGTFYVPAIEVGLPSTDGRIDFHNIGGNSDYDVRLSTDGAVAGTTGGGRLVVNAAKGLYVNGVITAAGGLSAVGNIAASGTVQGATLSSSGSLSVLGATSLQGLNAASIVSSANISAAGSVFAANGTISLSGATLSIRDPSTGTAGNTHLWFYNNNGSERGLIYQSPDYDMHFRIAAGPDAMTISSNRNVSFGANIYAAGNVFANSGGSYLQTDGNIYGPAWGGFLSTWMGANLVYKNTLRADSVSWLAVGEVGSIGFFYTNTIVGPGSIIAGANLAYGYDGGQGSFSPGGTWRCHGDAPAGRRTVFMRIG